MESSKDGAAPKRPFHELVAEKLIAQLEAGTAPWQKPWEASDPGSFMPMNPTTGKRYKGINAIHLMSQGRDDERWMTYKQATAAGAQVRRGEKGTPVQYWKFDEEQDKRDASGKIVRGADGQPEKERVKLERPRVFFATVFNAEQIDGLPPREAKTKPEHSWDLSDRMEAIVKASGVKVQHGEHDRAFYRPSTDNIHMPDRAQFPTASRYYATLAHELGHATGHPTRLDRDLVHPFGSEGYAKEELRAEIASMILGDELGMGHDPGQHAAYVGSWIKVLKDDPLEIFRAASDAEKIRDFVMGLEQQQTQQLAPALSQAPEHSQALATADIHLSPQRADELARRDLQALEQTTNRPKKLAEIGSLANEHAGYSAALMVASPAVAREAALSLAADTRSNADRDLASTYSRSAIALAAIQDNQDALARAPEVTLASIGGAVAADLALLAAIADPDGELRHNALTEIGRTASVLEDYGRRLDDVAPAVATAAVQAFDWRAENERQGQSTPRAPAAFSDDQASDHLAALARGATLAPAASPLDAPIGVALHDPAVNFDHYTGYTGADQGGTLAAAMIGQGTMTVGQVVGQDQAAFYETAYDRLGSLFDGASGTTNAGLERKGLAQHFAATAETLLQTAARHQVAATPEAHMIPAKRATNYSDELARLLKASTLTPGVYRPSEDAKASSHAAVCVDNKPVILTGPSDDPASVRQAELLAANPQVQAAARTAAGLGAGDVYAATVSGSELAQYAEVSAVIGKPAGQVEAGGDDGPLVAIVLEDPYQALATTLAVNTSAARILDPSAPDLDDGHTLARLARAEELAEGPSLAEIVAENRLEPLPEAWTGQIEVEHVVRFQNGRVERAGAVADAGGPERVEPGVPHREQFQLHARDGAAQPGEDAFVFLGHRSTAAEAHNVAEQLKIAHALTLADEYEKAVRLAKVDEDRVRRDPNSTDEARSAAKEARKTAEASAFAAAADTELAAQRERDQARADRGAGDGKSPDRTVLDVPYREKNQAKELGAKWDRAGQTWYVPPGVDLAPFARWTPKADKAQEAGLAGATLPNPQPEADRGLQARPGPSAAPSEPAARATAQTKEREYLAVPYADRMAAKAAGALWDKAASSWYVGPKGDAAALAKWKPDNVRADQAPAMKPEEEFADALKAMGLVLNDPKSNVQHPIMDGKRHRIAAVGDKAGEKAGFYVGHLDGHPAGYIMNNRTGKDMRWKSKGYVLDPAEKAKLQAEAATKLAAREAEQTAAHEKTAARLASQMAAYVPVDQPTPYLAAKGVNAHAGVYTDASGKDTIIPAIDSSGKQWSTQYVKEDGTKRFAKDSRKEGCFHPVGGLAALDAAPVIIVAEGYATAATIAESVGHATVAAFDSGNLPAVARALRERYPDKPMLIAGDDDQAVKATQGVNPGAEKAAEAAKEVGGKAITPIFAAGEQQNEPKRFTDFNDLATKSALGREAVARQVGAAVKALHVDRDDDRQQTRKQTRDLQQDDQQQPQRRRAARMG